MNPLTKIFGVFLTLFVSANTIQAQIDLVDVKLESTELTSIDGTIELSLTYFGYDSIDVISNEVDTLPAGWSTDFSSGPTAIAHGDSVVVAHTVSYPVSELPYYPVVLELMTHARNNEGREVINELEITIYVTPYNTVEVWNSEDIQELPREWVYGDNNNAPPRVFVDPMTIPQSDVTPLSLDWQQHTLFSNLPLMDFQTVEVPGLAYKVLMHAPTGAELDSLRDIGDGVDSADGSRALFTGTVTGRLLSRVEWEFGGTLEIPMKQVVVRLRESDAIFDDDFGTAITDNNGFFTINYSKNQIAEGSTVELYVEAVALSPDLVMGTRRFLCDLHKYKFTSSQINAPQNAGTINFGDKLMVDGPGFSRPYEAINAVHWCQSGFDYFQQEGVPLPLGLEISVHSVFSSRYQPTGCNFTTIFLNNGDGAYESIPYHEFGHFTMHRLQNNFLLPCYAAVTSTPNPFDFFHSDASETTTRAAWVEGWAHFIANVLDAVNRSEDGEYGKVGTTTLTSTVFSAPLQEIHYRAQNVNNGIRGETIIGNALYDLWDGPNKGLPTTMPSFDPNVYTVHGYEDRVLTGSLPTSSAYITWRSVDDVEFSFKHLCQPLQDNTGSNAFKALTTYYNYLASITTNAEDVSDISRTFKENNIQFDVEEYESARHLSNLSTDNGREFVQTFEDVATGQACSDYFQLYTINSRLIDASNVYHYNSLVNVPQPITDEHWIGNNTGSGQAVDFFLNGDPNFSTPHKDFVLTGWNLMDVRNGALHLGADGKTAELQIDSRSMLRVRPGASLIIPDGSTVRVMDGGDLLVHTGATIDIQGTGKIIVEPGGNACIGSGTNITLATPNSEIIWEPGSGSAVSTHRFYDGLLNPSFTLCSHPQDLAFSGTGSISFFCADHFAYTHESFVIGVDIPDGSAFSGNLAIDDELIVPAGMSVTFTGTLQFSPYARVVIEPGAKMTLDGGTMTNVCSDALWNGVEVHGNAFQSQTPVNFGSQGFFEIKNGALVENAINAVRLIATNETTGSLDWSKTGGIVRASNSTFQNNWRAFEFMSYPHPSATLPTTSNLSSIIDCEFITTQELPSPYINPYSFVTMFGVRGINIAGNTFRYANLNNNTLRGSGIISIDASYNVKARCNIPLGIGQQCPPSDLDKNIFRDLYAGIITWQGAQVSDINVDQASFLNCTYGLRLEGANFNEVTRSEFDIFTGSTTFPFNPDNFGMYTDWANGLKVEGNEFNFSGIQATGDGRDLGIATSRNQVSTTDVFDNTFNGLETQVQTFNTNSFLQVDCNDLNRTAHTVADIHVAGDIPTQGSCPAFPLQTDPVGNVFAGTCNGVSNEWQMYLNPGVSPFTYNSYDPPSATGIDDVNCVEPGITVDPCFGPIFNAASACPTTLNLGDFNFTLNVFRTRYQQEVVRIDDANDLYDDGDTPGLLNLIATGSNGQVKNGLMDASPYLTDEVLEAYLLSSPPNGHIQQVILANSPVSQDIMDILDNMNLPNGIYNQIVNAQTGDRSERDKLDEQVSFLTQSKLSALNGMVRLYLDTNMIDSAVFVLENDNTLEGSCLLVPIETRRDTARAKTHISLIRSAAQGFIAEGDQARGDELNRFCDFHEFLIKIMNRPGGYFTMTAQERSVIEAFAANDTEIGVNARAILNFIDGTLPYLPAVPYNFNRSMIFSNNQGSSDGTVSLINKPNPFNGYTVIQGSFPHQFAVAQIVVHDVMGRELTTYNVGSREFQFEMDMNNYPSGVYLYALVVDGKRLMTKRMIKH